MPYLDKEGLAYLWNNKLSKCYTIELAVDGWQAVEGGYKQACALPQSQAKISPVILPLEGQSDYNSFTSADATPGVGIEFTTKKLPTTRVKVLILDPKEGN